MQGLAGTRLGGGQCPVKQRKQTRVNGADAEGKVQNHEYPRTTILYIQPRLPVSSLPPKKAWHVSIRFEALRN